MYLDSGEKKECAGCSACASICVHGAITMVADVEGFKYPYINNKYCVKCGLCKKICPISEPDYKNYDKPFIYASFLNDINQRQRSSSGGLFYAIACKTIEDSGIVYGAVMDINCQVTHNCAETISELEDLRGSKYVQSDMGHTFIEIKKNLNEGRKVYYVGTPCQVAGLKKYLIKSYDNLLTSDLVCHGVPSQKLLDYHIRYQEKKYKDKITKIQFRDNTKWEGCEILDFAVRKRVTIPTYFLSPYLYSFMYAYTLRESCYDCKFARVPRQGDISLADYWGVKSFFPEIDTSSGVSLCIVNSTKGEEVWSEISKQIMYIESNLEDATKFNHNVQGISEYPKIRNEIYKKIEKEGYAKIAKTYFRAPNWRRIYFKMKVLNLIGYGIIYDTYRIIKRLF